MLTSISTLGGAQCLIHVPHPRQTIIRLRSDFPAKQRKLSARTKNRRAPQVSRIHTYGLDHHSEKPHQAGEKRLLTFRYQDSGCVPFLRVRRRSRWGVKRNHNERPVRRPVQPERVSPASTIETGAHVPQIRPPTSRNFKDTDRVSPFSAVPPEPGYPHGPLVFDPDSVVRPCVDLDLPTTITKGASPMLLTLRLPFPVDMKKASLHDLLTGTKDCDLPILPSFSELVAGLEQEDSEDEEDDDDEVPVFYNPFAPIPTILRPSEQVWDGRSFVVDIRTES